MYGVAVSLSLSQELPHEGAQACWREGVMQGIGVGQAQRRQVTAGTSWGRTQRLQLPPDPTPLPKAADPTTSTVVLLWGAGYLYLYGELYPCHINLHMHHMYHAIGASIEIVALLTTFPPTRRWSGSHIPDYACSISNPPNRPTNVH